MDLLSPQHLIVILLIVLLLFGGKKIPELMRGLGRGIREFKDAKDNVTREIEDHINTDTRAQSNSTPPVSTPPKQVSSDPSVKN
jgi:sec-independent protein translocase protein TatA